MSDKIPKYKKWGYAQLSTIDHNEKLIQQVNNLNDFDLFSNHIISEKINGSVPALERPLLVHLFDKMVDGDILYVTQLDRLGRDALDILNIINELKKKNISVFFRDLNCNTEGWTGAILLKVISSLANGEKERIRERTLEGLAAAKKRGVRLGRRQALTQPQRIEVIRKLNLGIPVQQIAQLFGVTKPTIYRIKRELEEKAEQAPALPLHFLDQ